NETVLQGAARVLVRGGRLGLKVVNGSPILNAFRETDREEREGTMVTISRKLSSAPPRMREDQCERKSRQWTVRTTAAPLSSRRSVRRTGARRPLRHWSVCESQWHGIRAHDFGDDVGHRPGSRSRLT